MATKIVMAQLSPTMEEGKLLEWKVAEGDTIEASDLLAEIETDKANMDIEALGGGVVLKILVQAGATVPVGALIGIIGEDGGCRRPHRQPRPPLPSPCRRPPRLPRRCRRSRLPG